MYEIAGQDLLDEASSKLRLNEPSFESVQALVAELLPGISLENSQQAPVQVLAALPFVLAYSRNGQISVHAPPRAFDRPMMLKYFFQPTGEKSSQQLTLAGTIEDELSGMVRWESPVEWPKGALRAKAFLFFEESEVDEMQFTRWPSAGNLCIAVDAHFDPEHSCLREFVLGKKSKQGQNFEIGMVRLLNLLGIPVVWYGKGAIQGRPDLAAGLVESGGRKLVLLGECTREKPSEKLSALRERARELGEWLSGEAEVLAAVFTPSALARPDMEQSAEYGVSLVGRSDLESLFEMLEVGTEVEGIIAFLESRRCMAGPLGWGRPWGRV